jgi:hypothetical protein
MPRAAFRHADDEFSWQQSEFEAAVGTEGMIIWSATVRKQFLLFPTNGGTDRTGCSKSATAGRLTTLNPEERDEMI